MTLSGVVPDARALRAAYLAASPWPHLVLHDVFPRDAVAAAEASARRSAVLEHVPASSGKQRKQATGSSGRPPEEVVALLEVLEGPEWTGFLAELTGIRQLSSDPTRYFAGLHNTPVGGFTLVHTDFVRHVGTGLHHRTNTLLYLNSAWDPSWGGALEMWPTDMSAPGRSVLPEAGTVVVWETGPHTPHGLPHPVRTPDGRGRLAVAAYHYAPVPEGGVPRGRRRTYLRRPEDPWTTALPTRFDLARALGIGHTAAALRRLDRAAGR